MREAIPVTQSDAEMQAKGVLGIKIQRDHFLAGSRQSARNVGSERSFSDTTFG